MKALLVTTTYRGVFFGYGTIPTDGSTNIVLYKARMCVTWSSDVRGVLGLAAKGPSESCCVGPAVPKLYLVGVNSISEVSDIARKAWEKEPWT